MTPAKNKALMKRIFDRLAAGDRSLFVEHLHDDVTMTVTGSYSWSQTFRGKEKVLRDYFGYVGSLMTRPGRTIPFHFLADENWVVVEARGDMETKSGDPYRNHYCLMYRLQNGQIVEMKTYQDSAMCERVLGPFPARSEPSRSSPLSLSSFADSRTLIARTANSTLWDIGDRIACLEIETRLGICTEALIRNIGATTRALTGSYRALIISSACERFFSPGASAEAFLASIESGDPAPALAFLDKGQSVLQGLKRAPFPVVTAVHGAALSGGFELAMHSDAVVYEDQAQFGMRERWAGVLPAWGGGTQMLLRLQADGVPPDEACAEMFSAYARVTLGAPPPHPHNTPVTGKDALIDAAVEKAKALMVDYSPPPEAELTLAGDFAEMARITSDVARLESFAPAEVAACEAYARLLCPAEPRLIRETDLMRAERDALIELLMAYKPAKRFEAINATGKRPKR
ncbi:enoyl-CoA hydratase-related protein [Henriciella sp. AS95]|uniref:enoyl-CoA hydratase-related protein n=1 Tax=Henriciella sp. AS95 TaxID=3135782 RepID=UPI00317BADAF